MSCNKNTVNNLTVVMRVTINYFLDCPQIKISFWSFQVSLTTLWDLALPEYLTKRGEERLYTNYKWQNKEVLFTYNIQYCLKVKTQKQIRSKTFTRQNKNTTRLLPPERERAQMDFSETKNILLVTNLMQSFKNTLSFN